jgi:hypothetical protein
MREQSQLASPPPQPVSIPLEKIQPHPKLALRFRYSVESLAALILAAASGNVPNGQLEPGRVVPTEDGLGYYVYVGVKRFLALKLLFEKTHDVRFAAFNAYVDTNLSPLRMFVIAKMENEEGKGEREGLSVLEEVSGIGRIRDSVKPDELDEGLRRLHDLSEKLGEERLKKLYELERVAHFKFRVAHLERLCRIEGDEKDFYLAAASAAGYRFTGDDIEEAVEARSAAYNLEWFKDLFPSYSSEAPPPPTSPSSGHDQDGNQGGEGEAEGKGREEQGSGHLEVHLEEVVLAACPKCEGENMVKLDGEVKASDFVYIDPPYDVEFRQYSAGGFTWEDQERVARWSANLGGPVVISNQATGRIMKLYKELGFSLRTIDVPRFINCVGSKRGSVKEVLGMKGV